MYRSCRGIAFRFNSKARWQIFLLHHGRHVFHLDGHQHCSNLSVTNMSPYKFFKFGWNTSPNSADNALHLSSLFYLVNKFHFPLGLRINGRDMSCLGGGRGEGLPYKKKGSSSRKFWKWTLEFWLGVKVYYRACTKKEKDKEINKRKVI